MKDKYIWNYTIRIKTKEGTFEYEKEDLSNIDLLLEKHKDYEELRATQNKKLVKRRDNNGIMGKKSR